MKTINKTLFIIIIVIILLGVFIWSFIQYKNAYFHYQPSTIRYSKTLMKRDECVSKKWEGIQDIVDLKNNKQINIDEILYSPGLDVCFYKLIQRDKNQKNHYFIKNADTKQIIYEISPNNIWQRISGNIDEVYFNNLARTIMEVPNVEAEVRKINAKIAQNGPLKICASADEVDKVVSDCIYHRKINMSREEMKQAFEEECSKAEVLQEWIKDHKLINSDSFGYSRIYMTSETEGYAEASNKISQNDLLKSPLSFSAVWDGECWNLERVGASE